MSGLQQAQLLYAAAVRSRVPSWAPFLQFPNVFGSPFLTHRHQLVNSAANGELPAAATTHSSSIHRGNPSDQASEDSNDDRGKFYLHFCINCCCCCSAAKVFFLPTVKWTRSRWLMFACPDCAVVSLVSFNWIFSNMQKKQREWRRSAQTTHNIPTRPVFRPYLIPTFNRRALCVLSAYYTISKPENGEIISTTRLLMLFVVISHFPHLPAKSRQQTRKWEKDDWICKVYMTHNSLQSKNINLTFMISNNHSCLLAVNNKPCRRWCMRVVELFTHWMRGLIDLIKTYPLHFSRERWLFEN